jgi:uncharacterized delta-60 repeat protein
MKNKNPPSIICLLAVLLSACGGGGDSSGPPAPTPPANNPPAIPAGTIGAAGGMVAGPSGSQVVIPAGALTQDVVINIAANGAGAPPLPSNMVAAGQTFALTPHGTSFATPATVTIPFDPALIPPGETPLLYKTNAAQTGWEPVVGATVNGATMTGQISGFSWILTSRIPPPPPPVFTKDEPKRWYEFDGWDLNNRVQYIRGNMNGGELEEPSPPGILHDWMDFGFTPQLPSGGIDYRTVEVYSSENGRTYWVGAQAPNADLLGQTPEESWAGSASQLRQDQSYQRYAANATMEIVITQIYLEVADYNGTTPRFAGCPWLGAEQTDPRDCHDSLEAAVSLNVQVLSDSALDVPYMSKTLSSLNGTADLGSMSGAPAELKVSGNPHRRQKTHEGYIEHPKHRSIFKVSDFLETGDTQTMRVTLRKPLHVPVDISDTPLCDPTGPVECKEFTVRIWALATAGNRRAGETYARAFLRDPVNFGGDVEVITTGLTATNRPLPDNVPIDVPVLPECTNGSQAEAGTVHFTTPNYRIMEFGQVSPQIHLVRTGGSAGQVIVNVRSRDDTAVAGTHYQRYSATFVFNDGDDVARTIDLQTLDNDGNDGNVSLDLVLMAKDGCATLGDPAETRVTIVDDEARPVPNNNPSGTLDSTFGTDGKVNTAPFGGDGSKMLRQPDGKLVIVGGSTVDFLLARFNADGTPDTTFGSAGHVITDILGGFNSEHARAVAIQPDGKLVVAGEGSPDFSTNYVTLARYNTDGTLDRSFGIDGKVSSGPVVGRAWAVAVQADGKIVVAGDQYIGNRQSDFGDVLVARYNADGSVDAGFASSGLQVFDAANGTDQACNVVVQPDGKILVAGVPVQNTGVEPTVLARLDANGALDSTFGNGGKLIISTARIGHGLALQPDGKLLLAGATMGFPSSFALMRLNTDGSYDSAFGNGGAVTASITHSTSGVGDRGTSLALDPDGRIYVAGIAGSINHDFGLARFTSAGVLDTSFAGTGSMIVDFNALEDGAESIALEPNGKIVLGGYATPTSSEGFGLARIHP